MVMTATASALTMAPADLLIGLRERVPLSEAQVARGTGAETETVRAWLERREAPGAVHGQRLTELVAMTCLPGTDPRTKAGKPTEWLLWLDLWALSPRNAGVASVRRKFDERWRQTIETTVLTGQEAGEFSATVDASAFAVTLSAISPIRRAA